jgi:hypothetical protein
MISLISKHIKHHFILTFNTSMSKSNHLNEFQTKHTHTHTHIHTLNHVTTNHLKNIK